MTRAHPNVLKNWFLIALGSFLCVLPAVGRADDKEAFLVRRIAEFWKDGDFGLVKDEIHNFLDTYPKSELASYLWGILGDLSLQEGRYTEALKAYESVRDGDILQKTLVNRLQCYYELNAFAALISVGKPYLNTLDLLQGKKEEYLFLMAEGYFRQIPDDIESAEAKGYAQKALPLYENLLGTEYDKPAALAMAEIYRLLKQPIKGLELYQTLAAKYPDKEEILLFNAAVMEIDHDLGKASELFKQVVSLGGKKANEARYHLWLLDFRAGNYHAVVEASPALASSIAKERLPLFWFIVAESHYFLRDAQKTLDALNCYLAENPPIDAAYRDSCLMAMSASKELKNYEKFQEAFYAFQRYFPEDSQQSKAYFLKALCAEEQGEVDAALQALAYISNHDPSFEKTPAWLFEYGSLLHRKGMWADSYAVFRRFLDQFPADANITLARRFFLSSAVHRYEVQDSGYSKAHFLTELQEVLTYNEVLEGDELREYTLLVGQLAYELGHFDKAQEVLAHYIAQYPDHHSTGDAHLWLALTLSSVDGNVERGCEHLEEALAKNIALYDTAELHLQLFNNYLTLGRPADAARHLYRVFQKDPKVIELENRLWLASFYFDQRKDPDAMRRALTLYAAIFDMRDGATYTPSLEADVIKYYTLLKETHQVQEGLACLEKLRVQEEAHPEMAWPLRRLLLFERANAYEVLGDFSSALAGYEELIQQGGELMTPLIAMSLLKSAELEYALLAPEEKDETTPKVVKVLQKLKDLQIKKHVESEPAHLEAALTYATIRADLSPQEMRSQRYLFFLVRMKEDFTDLQDPLIQAYHAGLEHNPDKKELYLAYMQFVDAEILSRQAETVGPEEAARLRDKAMALYQAAASQKERAPFLKKALDRITSRA